MRHRVERWVVESSVIGASVLNRSTNSGVAGEFMPQNLLPDDPGGSRVSSAPQPRPGERNLVVHR